MSEGFLYIDQQNVVGSGNKIECSLNSFEGYRLVVFELYFMLR